MEEYDPLSEIERYLQVFCMKRNIVYEIIKDENSYIINITLDGKPAGHLTFSIRNEDVIHRNLRSTEISSVKKCLLITNIKIFDAFKGQKLGLVLVGAALLFGLQRGCDYSKLDDMSDNSQERFKNLYAKFGFTPIGVTEYASETKLAADTYPERQLELSPKVVASVFKKNFVDSGGTRRNKRRTSRFYSRRFRRRN